MGEEFGSYEVFEELGAGGMATVHRAETRFRNGTRLTLALKRLLPEVAKDPALVREFVREGQLTMLLKHPNIAQTFDVGHVRGRHFMALEYVKGPTLSQVILRGRQVVGPPPIAICVRLLAELASALDYAQTCVDDAGKLLEIIHRDVSPSNVIVSNQGTVKLIDFGIAKHAGTQAKHEAGLVKGKFGYIPPEYVTGGRLDMRADLWSWGVVAWELLAMRRLFAGKSELDTIKLMSEATIEPPSKFNPNVPPELDDIVMQALQRDPAMRWQSAAALRRALVERLRETPTTRLDVVEWIDAAFVQTDPNLYDVDVFDDDDFGTISDVVSVA